MSDDAMKEAMCALDEASDALIEAGERMRDRFNALCDAADAALTAEMKKRASAVSSEEGQ